MRSASRATGSVSGRPLKHTVVRLAVAALIFAGVNIPAPSWAITLPDGDYTGTYALSHTTPTSGASLGTVTGEVAFSISNCTVTLTKPWSATGPVGACGTPSAFFLLYSPESVEFRGEVCDNGLGTTASFVFNNSGPQNDLSPRGQLEVRGCPAGSYTDYGGAYRDWGWTATTAASHDYDGLYSGTYRVTYDPYGRLGVSSGTLSYTVLGDSFTMTEPWAVTGHVSPNGELSIYQTDAIFLGFLCKLDFSGTILGSSAAGDWEYGAGLSGCQASTRGTWSATLGATPEPTPTPPGVDTYYPSSLQVFKGKQVAGSVRSLRAIDGSALSIKSVWNGTRYKVDYNLALGLPLVATPEAVVVEVATTNSIRMKLWAWNWSIERWDFFDPVIVAPGETAIFTLNDASEYLLGTADGHDLVLGITNRKRTSFTHKLDLFSVTLV